MFRLSLLAAFCLSPACTISAQEPDAVSWANRSFEFASKIQDADSRDHAFYRLARRYSLAHKFDLANQCSDQIAGAQKRVYSLGTLAKAATDQGEKEIANRAVTKSASVSKQSNNLHAHSHAIKLLLESDRIDDALSFSINLKSQSHKHYTLNRIASHLTKRGDLDWALNVVNTYVDRNAKDRSYSEIAVACAETGLATDAETIIQMISKPAFRDNPISALARHEIENGKFKKARKLAGRMTNEQRQSDLIAKIANQESELMDDEALCLRFEEEKDIQAKTMIGTKIVKRFLDSGDVDDAINWIEKSVATVESNPREPIRSKFGQFDDSSRITALKLLHLNVAEAYHADGKIEEAVSQIEIARKALANLDDKSGIGKVFLQQTLLVTIAKLNLGDQFPTAAQSTEVGFMRSMGVANRCESFVMNGEIEKAMEMAEELDSKTDGTSLGKLLVALLENDEEGHAVQLLNRLGNSDQVGYACEVFGKAFLSEDKEDMIDETLSQLKSNAARAHICIGIAACLQSE